MPSALQEFSQELRRTCLLRGSIAQLCKGTGINRQQFNKYLAGQIFPSARNLRKICAYLGVTEAELMSPGAPGSMPVREPSTGGDTAIDLTHLSRVVVERLDPSACGSAVPANVLPSGYYDCYFPLYSPSEHLVRWLLQVRRVEGGLAFTCRTNVRSAHGVMSGAGRNRYHGVGISGGSEAYLIGTSRMQMHQPGILAISQIPVEGCSYFTGLAITPRLDGPVAITAALHYRGTCVNGRDALSELGIIGLSDPALNPVIARLMRAIPASGANWIQSVNGKSLRSAALSGGPDLNPSDYDRRVSA